MVFCLIYLSYGILPHQISPHSYLFSSSLVCPVVDGRLSEAVPIRVLKKKSLFSQFCCNVIISESVRGINSWLKLWLLLMLLGSRSVFTIIVVDK